MFFIESLNTGSNVYRYFRFVVITIYDILVQIMNAIKILGNYRHQSIAYANIHNIIYVPTSAINIVN